jgi:hypothetical protein
MMPKISTFEKEGCMYSPGYYYQPIQSPPGFEMNQGIIPVPQANIIYPDYMHPSMIPVQTFNGK